MCGTYLSYPKLTTVRLTGYLYDKKEFDQLWKKDIVATQAVTESIITIWIYSKADRLMLEEATQKLIDDMHLCKCVDATTSVPQTQPSVAAKKTN